MKRVKCCAGTSTSWPAVGCLWLAGALALSGITVGCAEHHYRVYDPYYSDYHTWDHGEDVYYQRWAAETHHDPHRDFRKLPPDEQKQYFTWRHNQSDNAHH
ncbi:MAG: hypothetical protein WBR26_23885 [Candidatus Acidiferrum sp.]